MKLIYTLVVAFTIVTTVTYANGKSDKKTLIEQIEEADSIPVYVILGKASIDKYNQEAGKIPLNSREIAMPYVTGTVPKEADTLKPNLVAMMNAKFNTTKFYAASTGTESEIRALILNNKVAFFVLAEFTADYNFNYAKGIRRDSENDLNASMDMWIRCIVSFNELSDKLDPIDRISFTVGGTRREVQLDGYSCNADEMMNRRSPLTIASNLLINVEEKIGDYASKQQEKHNKAVSKRK